MFRTAILGAGTLVLTVLPAAAQTPADSGDVLVLTHTFSAGSREFVRVFLDQGQVYRAEINFGQVSFSIRPRHPGGQNPTAVLIRGGTSASDEAVYEVYPFKDDEYEIQVLDFPAGETGHLRLYRDIRASQRRHGIVRGEDGRWTMGIELGGNYHGSYQVSLYEEFAGFERSSTGYEGCLSLRSPSARGWGCLIGVASHSSQNAPEVLWFFFEPRFRLVGGRPSEKLELGLSLRGGFGSVSESGTNTKPAILAPGAYVRIWFGNSPGKEPSLALAGHNAFILGADNDGASFTQIGASLAWHF